MKQIKYKIVKLLDWFDDKILGHRYLIVCKFITITLDSWWIDE